MSEYFYSIRRLHGFFHEWRLEKECRKKKIESIAKLKKLKDKHLGQRCFIVGNGPSLQVSDLDKLQNEICFGMNRIYYMFNKTKWRPTYYCVQDYNLIKKSHKNINTIKGTKFIGVIDSKEYSLINNGIYIPLASTPIFPDKPNFSDDITVCVYEGFTVTYMCLQIAMYLGFSEIYLLGIDNQYSIEVKADGTVKNNVGVKDHFDSNDFIENPPYIYKNNLAYESAKDYAQKREVKIINSTRGGKLEVFPRIEFDSLF